MFYASIGIIALVHHQIINYDILKNGKKMNKQGPHYKYAQFLHSIFAFFVADILWGFITEYGNRILAYIDTTIFFAIMALSVLLWTRYVVAFLNKDGIRAKTFLAGGWFIFGFVIFHLIVNIFNPCIFYFTEEVEYVPEIGRYFILGSQFLMYILISIYSLVVSFKTTGRDKIHYRAVGFSGSMMAIFIVIQNFYPLLPFYTVGYFFANSVIHVFVEEDEKKEQNRQKENIAYEKEMYNMLSSSLAKNYEAIYLINSETGKYREISANDTYKSLFITKEYEDFFKDTLENIRAVVHPDDRRFAEYMFNRETVLMTLENRSSYSFKYRVLVHGEPRYYRFTVILADDEKHIVVLDKDINDTITAETALREKQKVNVTFSQIAESLASNYDVIYYVNIANGNYAGYTSHNIYGTLDVNESGEDFFNTTIENIPRMIHPQDRDRLIRAMNSDYLLSVLELRKQFNIEYRLIVDAKPKHARMSIRKSSDEKHFIIGVENIEEEVKKEQERLQALNTEKELARRDELTGIRNKTAYTELEQSIQNNIDRGMDYIQFAIAVCDLNELKKINDTLGHQAGDEYIKSSAKLLCDIFDHSPVFRIGGDEFAIFLSGDDYTSRNELISRLHSRVMTNLAKHSGPVIAVGMAEFKPDSDTNVSDIFDRADHLMYDDKWKLKNNIQ